ncbi:MAG: M23 family metallopeptidase [Burkholderiaceae bacterium]|jgi:murein DD-endopeptidase MepM/ murein hydrolase activator NlpD|nr:M23 family metallopeptidase [Burkholderiaceae bacterium]
MHVIITDTRFRSTRAFELGAKGLFTIALCVIVLAVSSAVAAYHALLKAGTRNNWPIVGQILPQVASQDMEAQNRYLRENLDVMATRLGELQARMVQLDSLGERVAQLAGMDTKLLKPTPGAGGALVGERALSVKDFSQALADLQGEANIGEDFLTVLESRLLDQKLQRAMIPTTRPVNGLLTGSRFGRRVDPFTGSSAMHTGLDFPGPVGTPIYAAAGGVVVTAMNHSDYGNMIEVDHGNDVITRYAHTSRMLVKVGDLIKRGQKIGLIGSTGRSTGPHLHFEVWVSGRYKDPAKFLALGRDSPTVASSR